MTKKIKNFLLKKTFFLLIAISLLCNSEAAVSLVYNLRIAESTKRQAFEAGENPHKVALTLFNNNRKKRYGAVHNVLGLLETYSYITPSFYFRTDFAFGQVQDHYKSSHFKAIETDDLLFKSGYSYTINPKTKFSISGIFGIPTHKDFALEHFEIGFAHFGLGFQLDSSYAYSLPKTSAIRCAFRFIQFLPRKVQVKSDEILKYYNLNIGKLIDLFIAHHTVFDHHSFQVGYDQIFFCDAKIHPFLESTIEKVNYMRPEFFSTYKYTLATHYLHHIFSATISGGFDIWPHIMAIKESLKLGFLTQ